MNTAAASGDKKEIRLITANNLFFRNFVGNL